MFFTGWYATRQSALAGDELPELSERQAVDDVLLGGPRPPRDVHPPHHLPEPVGRVGVRVDREHGAGVERGAGVDVVEVEARVAGVDLQRGPALGGRGDDRADVQWQPLP